MMPACGWLMIGPDAIEPSAPVLLTVNVPPGQVVHRQAALARAHRRGRALPSARPATLFWSASRTTGTTSPFGDGDGDPDVDPLLEHDALVGPARVQGRVLAEGLDHRLDEERQVGQLVALARAATRRSRPARSLTSLVTSTSAMPQACGAVWTLRTMCSAMARRIGVSGHQLLVRAERCAGAGGLWRRGAGWRLPVRRRARRRGRGRRCGGRRPGPRRVRLGDGSATGRSAALLDEPEDVVLGDPAAEAAPATWPRSMPYFRASDLTNGEARFGAPFGRHPLGAGRRRSRRSRRVGDQRAGALAGRRRAPSAATSAARAGLAEAAGTAGAARRLAPASMLLVTGLLGGEARAVADHQDAPRRPARRRPPGRRSARRPRRPATGSRRSPCRSSPRRSARRAPPGRRAPSAACRSSPRRPIPQAAASRLSWPYAPRSFEDRTVPGRQYAASRRRAVTTSSTFGMTASSRLGAYGMWVSAAATRRIGPSSCSKCSSAMQRGDLGADAAGLVVLVDDQHLVRLGRPTGRSPRGPAAQRAQVQHLDRDALGVPALGRLERQVDADAVGDDRHVRALALDVGLAERDA